MSAETADAIAPTTLERLAPFVVPRRDRVLPILIGASLVVHATVFLPSLFHRKEDKPQAQEIPVEIVQQPPEAAKPPAPRPRQAQTPPPEPKQASKQASNPAPKPTPKPTPKPAPKVMAKSVPKPPAPKVAQKPPPPKPQPKPQQSASGEERMKRLLGPMPAIALPGAAANGDDAVDYSQLVLSKVAKAKKQGRYNGVPGASSVAFSIGDGGDVLNVHTVRPSGDPALDEEAIAMVKRGAPYPPPPPGGRRDYAITLRFQAL